MPKQTETAEVHAARRGDGLHKWVNDKTPGADAVVLTDATLYYNVPEGKQVLITAMHFDVETDSDDVHVGMVSCSAVAGGGDATEISGHAHIFTGAAVGWQASKERPFYPPILVTYSSGARSVSMKVNANDAAAVLSCGWTGWVEDET